MEEAKKQKQSESTIEKIGIAQNLRQKRKPFKKLKMYTPLSNVIEQYMHIWYDEIDSSDWE